jgi:hypothetical protein
MVQLPTDAPRGAPDTTLGLPITNLGSVSDCDDALFEIYQLPKFGIADDTTAILSLSASRVRYTDLRRNHGMLGGLDIRPANEISNEERV